MKRGTSERLQDILEAAREAQGLAPQKQSELATDRTAELALTRLVEIIGEAANHVDDAVRRAHAELPWAAMIGMRHHITHGYFDVDLDMLWEVVTLDIPKLIPEIEAILAGLPGDQP